MTIEELTPDELIEALEDFMKIIPVIILLIKFNQRAGPVEADAVDVDVGAPVGDQAPIPQY